MSTAPSLLLNRKQTERLLTYMQEYRRSALSTLPPTQERNTTLRLVQALPGKLLALCEQDGSDIPLLLRGEEVAALKDMAKSLILFYGGQAESACRTMTVTDLGKLYVYLKHISERERSLLSQSLWEEKGCNYA